MQDGKAECFGKERSVVPDGAAQNFSLNSFEGTSIINVR